jgi:hypothetical protein
VVLFSFFGLEMQIVKVGLERLKTLDDTSNGEAAAGRVSFDDPIAVGEDVEDGVVGGLEEVRRGWLVSWIGDVLLVLCNPVVVENLKTMSAWLNSLIDVHLPRREA